VKKQIDRETLGVGDKYQIDPNFSNKELEWIVCDDSKDFLKFTDVNAKVVCTGIMIRVTDNHPGLLNDSHWWCHSSFLGEELKIINDLKKKNK